MSKTVLFLISFLTLAIFGVAGMATAQASESSKGLFGGWPEKHWENQNFQPYYEPAKLPHNSQWDYDDWKSGDWFQQEDREIQLINGFYNANILSDQYMDDDMPVLEVGPNFYNLGGFDKRRVTQVVDEVFGITGSKLFGSFMLYDSESEAPIGIYTQQGLQLQ